MLSVTPIINICIRAKIGRLNRCRRFLFALFINLLLLLLLLLLFLHESKR